MSIEYGDRLFGIRYWALWKSEGLPRYTVFRYIGHYRSKGHYIFQSVHSGLFFYRSHYQLQTAFFKPFVLSTKHLTEGDADALSRV